jgi:pimeloyl-ACP methyl ester carboxylesterase
VINVRSINATSRLICGIGVICAVLALSVAPAAVATSGSTSRPKPVMVPNSRLPGAAAFEGPVYKVPVNGIKIGYRQFGKGPDLIMVTGDTAPMSLWMPYLLKPLAKHFTVTIFDNRGVGYSTDQLSKPLTVQLMAQDTGDLIQTLGLAHPTLVGWSMGGEIGLTLAEQKPTLLGALITSGGDAGSPHTVPPPPGLLKQLANPKAGPRVFLKLLFPPTRAGGAAAELFGKTYEEIPQEKVSARTLKRQQKAEAAFLRYTGTWRRLGSITTPTLITNGALDKGVPLVNPRRLHAEIKGSSLSIYGGAAHGMMFQDATRFASQAATFSSKAGAAETAG